jgi:propanediol dehydratase large subunit
MFEHEVTELDITIVHDTHLEQRTIVIEGGLVPLTLDMVIAPDSLARIYQVLDRHATIAQAQINNMALSQKTESMFATIPFGMESDDEEETGWVEF